MTIIDHKQSDEGTQHSHHSTCNMPHLIHGHTAINRNSAILSPSLATTVDFKTMLDKSRQTRNTHQYHGSLERD